MFRIRKLSSANSEADRSAIAEAQDIIRAQFPGIAEEDVAKLPAQLENPFAFDLVSGLLVADDEHGRIRAFALVRYAPDLRFAFLDTMSVAPGRSGAGIGGAMYQRVREEALALGAEGLYFECLPDDPALSPNGKIRAQNAARLRFYERYDARPIEGSRYEEPVEPGTTDSPYLVYDGLGRFELPAPERLRAIVRAILERKYGELCPPAYIDMVVGSIGPGTRLRAARYAPAQRRSAPKAETPQAARIPIVVNDRHDIHHIRERGYVESPVRIASIVSELDRSGLFRHVPPRHFGRRYIAEVHDGGLIDFIERACAEAPLRKSIYPYVFPIRNANRKPVERSVLAGYWCIDTFTPLNRNAYPAARRAVDCALTAASLVLEGAPAAYALVRPPGHHAERRAFGGFCYFNNGAVAAQYLSKHGRVAVLDVDYHHGNGTQDIFYERSDVLTVSVHGHPRFAYPYFTGFREETGRGAGAGYNLNIPLPEKLSPDQHREAVATALKRVARHKPAFLVLALGLDTAYGDPTGTWENRAIDFHALGRMIGEARLPTVVVQEGGYRVRTLGVNARNFFAGLTEAVAAAPARPRPPLTPPQRPKSAPDASPDEIEWREAASEADISIVRRMVEATAMFTAEEAAIAVELVEERIAKGRLSGYHFVFAEDRNDDGNKVLGYACYGPTPGTDARWDLYWIVVAPEAQGRGIGRAIAGRVERLIADAGGRRIYVDTSSIERYAKTRRFYRLIGYRQLAELADFYRDGDDKVIFVKDLER